MQLGRRDSIGNTRGTGARTSDAIGRQKKKNVLSCLIGPPTVAPKLFSHKGGIGMPALSEHYVS